MITLMQPNVTSLADRLACKLSRWLARATGTTSHSLRTARSRGILPPQFAASLTIWVAVCSIGSLATSPRCQAETALGDIAPTYEFLVSPRSTRGGALYAPVAGFRQAIALPYSYSDSEQYWGAYVCNWPDARCAVTDVYNPADYSLQPQTGSAGVLQTERVNVHNGISIYDAATWQIAVVLGGVLNHLPNPLDADPYALARSESEVVQGSGSAPNLALGMHATSSGEDFLYNGRRVTDPTAAYAYRMMAPSWLADDPLMETRYARLIGTGALPGNRPGYRQGRISWSDWKPITGENAWGYLLGPLHAAYIHYVLGEKRACVPFSDPAVQNALKVLPTFALMQSRIGAIYFAPSGTLENDRNVPVSRYSVSVENNFSVYAGLTILSATLRAESRCDEKLSSPDARRVRAALLLIHSMIEGGSLDGHRTTEGLLAFFRKRAWIDGLFVQGGIADDPAMQSEWMPVLEPKAVDVNTWGVAALGAARVDEWFGFGASYELWQRMKSWGAYGVGRKLLGVGYSDVDGNGQNADQTYRQGVLSGEWTAGAILMLRDMIRHYAAAPPAARHLPPASLYEKDLREDEKSMTEGIQTLRYDRYLTTAFPGKPDDYQNLVIQPTKPYLYASKRYLVPFGWYANPLPSTCASAWVIMLADDFDPFAYGGAAK
jgi:hypothetical protein